MAREFFKGILSHLVSTGGTELVLEQLGDSFGATRLRLQNRVGANGAIFEQAGTPDLVDFIFKSLSHQRNLRFESRAGNVKSGTAGPEFQLGPADEPALCLTDTAVFARKPLQLPNVTSRPAAVTGQAVAYAENGQLSVRNADGVIVPVSEVDRLTADMAAITSNTVFTDITGLSFPIASGEQVEFEARIRHSTAVATTGLVVGIGGPAVTFLNAEMWTWTSATAIVRAFATAIDAVITMTGTVTANTDQWAYLTGTIKASAAGTVQLKARSEVSGSGVTIKAGSTLNVLSRG